MLIPLEIYDAITLSVENALVVDYIRYTHEVSDTRKRLAVLRLVNKGFCLSASPRLFRSVRARYPFYLKDKKRPLVKLFQLSRSRYAFFVREVEVGFDRPYDSGSQCESFVQDLSELLPICLGNFPMLNILIVRAPYLPFDAGCCVSSQYHMRSLANTVADTLRYVPLLELRELTLAFPITYEFGKFFDNQPTALQVSIEHVMRRLQHLRVDITDDTGHGEDSFYSIPLSPAKRAYPNAAHAFQLFRFIELAEDLDSFYLLSRDILNLDGLNFSHLCHLQVLCFSNVAISYEYLMSLLEQCKQSLNRVKFHRVELNSGRWQNVLVQMSQLPFLRYFQIDSSGYSRTGRSSDLALSLSFLPPVDDPLDIESRNFLDFHALGNLQRKINANRRAAKLPQIAEFEYLRLPLEPLENMLNV